MASWAAGKIIFPLFPFLFGKKMKNFFYQKDKNGKMKNKVTILQESTHAAAGPETIFFSRVALGSMYTAGVGRK